MSTVSWDPYESLYTGTISTSCVGENHCERFGQLKFSLLLQYEYKKNLLATQRQDQHAYWLLVKFIMGMNSDR